MVKLTLEYNEKFITIAKIESDRKTDKLNGEILSIDPIIENKNNIISDLQDINIQEYYKKSASKVMIEKSEKMYKFLSTRKKPDNSEDLEIYNQITKDSANHFKLKTGQFIPLPNINMERTIWYLFGASGSGKSYLSASIIKQWLKLNLNSEVYIFSKLNDDVALDNLGLRTHRVQIDTLLDEPIVIEDIPDGSLILYDDVDTETNKTIANNLYNLLDSVLQIGRHKKISAIITSHTACNYRKTKVVLNESHYIIVYPNSGSFYQINYLLKTYCGLSNNQVSKVRNLSSRWVCFYRWTPQYLLTENECFILKHF